MRKQEQGDSHITALSTASHSPKVNPNFISRFSALSDRVPVRASPEPRRRFISTSSVEIQSTMEDVNDLHPSKKRVADRQLSKDNPGLDDDDEGTPEQEMGTFKKASDDVMAARRIVKVRRHGTSSAAASVPSANPFAGIRLVPSAPASVAPAAPATPPAGIHPVPPAPSATAPAEATVDTPDGGEEAADEEVNQILEEKKESENVSEVKDGYPEKKSESVTGEVKIDGSDKAADSCSAGGVDTEDAAKGAAETKPNGDGDGDGDGDGGSEIPEHADHREAAVDGVGITDKTKPNDEKESGSEKAEDDKIDKGNSVSGIESAPLSSFHHLSSSQNAFAGLASTGFSNPAFSFRPVSKDGAPSGSGFLFGPGSDQPSIPSFSFGTSMNGSSSLFGTMGSAVGIKGEAEGLLSMKEVPMETGEESEKTVFSADSVLFEFLDGGWKERGKGEVKVNISTDASKERARLVMRARGNLRLILNASIYPDMKLANMDKRGISFSCVNSTTEGKSGLSAFALKFKDSSVLESFTSAVAAHKGKAMGALKTPENSPEASAQ